MAPVCLATGDRSPAAEPAASRCDIWRLLSEVYQQHTMHFDQARFHRVQGATETPRIWSDRAVALVRIGALPGKQRRIQTMR